MRHKRQIILALSMIVLYLANGLGALAGSKTALEEAKIRIEKEHADQQKVLNSIPLLPSHKLQQADYTNVIWMNVALVRVGFPADQFKRDPNPRRENLFLHHSQYRLMLHPCAEAREFASVMSFVRETNFFRFVRTALNSTQRQIKEQPNMEALERCDVLLTTKSMMAPLGFDDFCSEFDRGDLKGFIVGDAARARGIYVRLYLEHTQQFIDLAVIKKIPLQISEIEDLICHLKIIEK